MENISINGDPSCAYHADFMQDLRASWIFYPLISVNIALCITTTLGNALILVSLQVCHLRAPSKLLFRSLAWTDLCVGLISQPCFVIFVFSVARQNCVIVEGAVYICSAILCGISLNTLTAISVDRLLALLLGLAYRQTVTLVRVRGIIIISWLVLAIHSMLYFWSVRIFMIGVGTNILLCIVVSSFCYMKIYFTLRYWQAQVLQQSEPNQLNNFPARGHVLRYKKTVSNSLWIYIAVLLFYLPYTSLTAVRNIHGDSRSTVFAEGFTATLVYLNSSLNPIIYCWKIREVRLAVKATVRRFVSVPF